jgi:hypothetical protein
MRMLRPLRYRCTRCEQKRGNTENTEVALRTRSFFANIAAMAPLLLQACVKKKEHDEDTEVPILVNLLKQIPEIEHDEGDIRMIVNARFSRDSGPAIPINRDKFSRGRDR